jgi:DNA-binding MarR family transcriptional regulator
MQVLIIAVQNAVDYHDLGVATSNAILFRFIGGSLGTALLGAVLATQLNQTKSLIAALDTVFSLAAAVAFLGFLLALLLPERRLRETLAIATEADIGGDIGQAFAMPQSSDSRAQLMRMLAVLADRDVRRRYVAAIVERAGVDLSPGAAWLLVQIEREPNVNIHDLGRKGKADPVKLQSSKAELLDKSLVAPTSATDVYQLNEAGCEIYNRLVAARREHLAELWPEWSPKKREEVFAILRQLARELIPETKPA